MIESFSEEECAQNLYLLCSRDYIYYKSKGLYSKEIISILNNIYKPEILSEVIEDLDINCDVFKYQNYPTCFNCNECKIQEQCYYMEVLGLLKIIQEKHKENQIDQNSLKQILDFNL